MTIAFVQKGANSQVGDAGNQFNTPTITGVTAGNWLVASGWAANDDSTPPTPSGWTLGASGPGPLWIGDAGHLNTAIFYKQSAGGGTESCTFDWNDPGAYSECSIIEVSAPGGLVLGPTARVNQSTGVNTVTAGPTSATATQTLVVGVCNMLDDTFSATNIGVGQTGFTSIYNDALGTIYLPGDSVYKIVSAGTQQATWSWTNNGQASASLTTFTEGSSSSPTTATPAAGVATVSGAGASKAATGATAAAGVATVSAAGAARSATTATAAAGAATVSGVGASSAATTATPAAGSATVSATTGSGTVASTDAVPAAGSATVSASGSSTAETTATPAAGFATVSGNTSDIDYEAMAAAVWAYTLPNGKTAAETAVETLTLLKTMAAAPGCLDVPIEGIFTGADLLRVIAAVQAGKTTITPTAPDEATVAFRAIDDSTTRVTATMEGSERTDVDIDAAD